MKTTLTGLLLPATAFLQALSHIETNKSLQSSLVGVQRPLGVGEIRMPRCVSPGTPTSDTQCWVPGQGDQAIYL